MTDDDTPLHYGHFEIRPRERQLLVDGRAAILGSRAFDLLLALATLPGRLLTKHELLDIVWPNLIVEENNLQVQISTLRKLLGPATIATIPGRGYRFVATPLAAGSLAPVRDVQPPPDAPPCTVPHAAHAASQPSSATPSRSATEAPATPPLETNLPARLPALIGREDDLRALDALLQHHALVSVVGTGGIGKTLLAQHLLQRQQGRHAHGVCFIELAGIADPRQVVGAVAAAIGVPAGGGGDALEALLQVVAPLDLLIAIDNAEHLIDEVARVASALHAGAPRAALLVTSQAPLQIDAEHVYRVGPLTLPDDGHALSPDAALGYGAVALFVERVRQVDRRFALSAANVGSVATLCRRLDGLPLAIGLAAARVPLLGVEGLAAALGDRLKLLTRGGRDAAARHRTLRAALEWSHGLLEERDQRLFRRLGVVVGSASLELVRRLAVDDTLDEWAALEALSVLVDRSLVMLEPGADEAAPRYRLLESPRAYALEQLEAAAEAELLRKRHARALADRLAQAYESFLDGAVGQEAWRRDLEPDRDNARAAFAWAAAHDPAAAVALAPVLSILVRNEPSAHFQVFEAAEPLLDDTVSARSRAHVLSEGALRLPVLRGSEWAARALALCAGPGDARERYLALASLAWTQGMSGDAEAAASAVAAMELAYTAPPASESMVRGEQARAGLAIAQGRWDAVARHFRRCIEIKLAAGANSTSAEINLIEAELLAGQVDAAVRDGEQLLARLHGTRERWLVVWLHLQLVAAWLSNDGLAAARGHALQAWPQIALNQTQAALADHCALLAALEARPRCAARLVGYADAVYAAQRDSRGATEARSVERALARVRDTLADEEIERLRAAGAALGIEGAAALALAEHDGAG